jgi:hypothetical protein
VNGALAVASSSALGEAIKVFVGDLLQLDELNVLVLQAAVPYELIVKGRL